VYPLYSLLLFFAFILYAPVYILRMKVWRRERLYLAERLGLRLPKVTGTGPLLWVHAVSVGEVLSLRNVLAQVKRRHPSWRICFSTLTNTGYRVAREKLREADSIFFIPLDFAVVVRRFFQVLKPQLLILAESEFWPNLLRAAGKSCQGVLLINGRISLGSFETYRRLRPLSRKVLGEVDTFLVQTEKDKERLETIGIDPDRIRVAGNLKAEVDLPAFTGEELAAYKKELGLAESSQVIVAGSTHKGEEEIILEAFRQALKKRQDLTLILAPRHPERAGEIMRICVSLSLRVRRRTGAASEKTVDVMILDTIGELAHVYALADLAFVGGSLVRHGGQNFLEPAFYAKPVLLGPHLDNFAALAGQFLGAGAARVVSGREELTEAFCLTEEEAFRKMGQRAKALLDSLQGATDRTLETIEGMVAAGCAQREQEDK
jgi:3-deoxy-D-manno-octulosonic-acid transferase